MKLWAGVAGIGSLTHEAIASGANFLSDESRHGYDEVGCLVRTVMLLRVNVCFRVGMS